MDIEVTIQDEHIGIRGLGEGLRLLCEEDAKDLYIQLGTALRIYHDWVDLHKKVKQ